MLVATVVVAAALLVRGAAVSDEGVPVGAEGTDSRTGSAPRSPASAPASASASPSDPASASASDPPSGAEPAADVDGAVPRAEGAWSFMAQSPIRPRVLPAVAAGADEVFVWGGAAAGDAGRVLDVGRWPGDGARYDPVANRWSPVRRGPLSARAGAGAVWAGDRVIVWGGARTARRGGPTALGDGAVWDREEGWSSLPEAPIAPRFQPFLAWSGRALIVWGGQAFDQRPGEGQVRERRLGDGAVFEPRTGRWRRLPDPPITLRDPDAVTGGPAVAFTGDELVLVTRTEAVAYDVAADRWHTLQPPRPPLSSSNLLAVARPAVLDDQLVLGGTYPAGAEGAGFGSSLDLLRGEWGVVPSAPFDTAPAGDAAAVGRGVVFVPRAGPGESRAPSPARWLVAERRWEQLEPPPRPTTILPVIAGVGDHLVIWGGLPQPGPRRTPRMMTVPGVRWTPATLQDS